MKPIRWTGEMVNYYFSQGWWDNRTFGDIYDEYARKSPDKVAFIDSYRQVTFAQLKQITDRFALGLLELGFEKDDLVICQLPNCIEVVALRLACGKAGVILLSANIALRETELAHFCRQTSPKGAMFLAEYHGFNFYHLYCQLQKDFPSLQYLMVVGDKAPEGAIRVEDMFNRPLEERYPADYLAKTKFDATWSISQILATTGTTGLPKLIEWTDNNIKHHTYHYYHVWQLTNEERPYVASFFWSGPSMPGFSASVQAGGTVVFQDEFDPEKALAVIEKEKATFITGLPIHMIQMARHPNFARYDVGSVKFLSYAGAPFPAGVMGEVEEKFNAPVLAFYGAVDSSIVISILDKNVPHEVRYRAVGNVANGNELKLLDDDRQEVASGEIGTVYVRGPSCCGGYFKNPEMTLERWAAMGLEGWFNMEDLGRFDEYGNLMLVGRKSDMILRGGQNVFPAEIEGFLNGHPKVLNVAVISMPDPLLGERICAFVVPRQGENLAGEEMVSYLQEKKIARYKIPERLEIMSEFPMVGDKVNKRALKELIARKLEEEGGKKLE